MVSLYLSKGLMSRRSIPTVLSHYYDELPRVDKREQDLLITLARCGDIDARNRLIESKLGHAMRIACNCVTHNTEDSAELALYHLTRCIDSFLRNMHPNLDAYITFVLSKEVRKALYEESQTIKKSYQTAWRHRKAGVFDGLNFAVNSHDYTGDDLDLVNTLYTRLSPKIAAKLIVDQSPDSDLRDVIEKVIAESDDPQESRLIIELRIRGCTDQEVAEQTGKSKAYIAARRAALLHSIRTRIE